MVNPVSGASGLSGNQYTPGQIQAQIDLNNAQTALQNQDYPGALKAYEDAQKSDPTLASQLAPAISQLKGQIDLDQGQAALNQQPPDYETCLKCYQQAIIDDPDLSSQVQPYIIQLKGQIDLDKANTAQQNNDMPGMLKWYQQAAQDDPELAPELQGPIQQLQGQISFQNNDWPQIQNSLQEAQTLFYGTQGTGQAPNQPGAVALLQGLLTQYPNLDQYTDPSVIYAPLAQYQASMAMSPPDGTQGSPEQAIAILQNAILNHPGVLDQDPSIYYRMAQFAWAGSHIGQAQALFNQFAPYQAQYEQSFQDTTGPQAFAQQLSGNVNAVMSNFQTYAANWIANHTHTSSEFWQNNVLSSLTSIMPAGGYLRNAGKHPFIYHHEVHAESDAIGSLENQLKELRHAEATEHDPKKLKDIREQMNQVKQQKEDVDRARKGEKVDVNQPKIDKLEEQRAKETDPAKQKKLDKQIEQEKHHSEVRNKRFGLDTLTNTHTADAEDEKDEEGKVIGKGRGAAQDPGAPGYWGLGQTLAQAQAVYKSFGNISQSNPLVISQAAPSAAGTLGNYQTSVYGGMNLLNAEAHTYKMIYGGGTAAGPGFAYSDGVQARANAFDETYGLNYAGGDTTIGGQTFSVANNNALATANLSEQAAIGGQVSGQGGLAIGSQGLHAGGDAGGFVGAQAAGQVAENVLGQGGFAMAQGWAGVGAKADASFSVSPGGDIHANLGLGYAVGVGGYVQISANINFIAMGQDLAAVYGTGDHKFGGMLSRAGELAADGVSAVGSMESNVAGSLNSLVDSAQNYFGDNALSDIGAGGVKTLQGIGEGIGEVATDAADEAVVPIFDAIQQGGQVVSQVGSDFAQGKVGQGLEDAVTGTVQGVGNTVKNVATTAWNGVKRLFSWL